MRITTIEELRTKADKAEKEVLTIINDLEKTIREKLDEANTALSRILIDIEASVESNAIVSEVELLQLQTLGERYARTVGVKIVLGI
jgi:hypothetical protein